MGYFVDGEGKAGVGGAGRVRLGMRGGVWKMGKYQKRCVELEAFFSEAARLRRTGRAGHALSIDSNCQQLVASS